VHQEEEKGDAVGIIKTTDVPNTPSVFGSPETASTGDGRVMPAATARPV
jgi:hypothetical protein